MSLRLCKKMNCGHLATSLDKLNGSKLGCLSECFIPIRQFKHPSPYEPLDTRIDL